MKCKLININTKEEHLCDKVTIDGFDYYVSDEKPTKENQAYIRTDTGLLFNSLKGSNPHIISKYCRLIIATNNPNIDIPKVGSKVKMLAKQNGFDWENTETSARRVFEKWYKSQETHPFSEEDMIEFAEWAVRMDWKDVSTVYRKTTKELLQLWKEQKPKIVYYE